LTIVFLYVSISQSLRYHAVFWIFLAYGRRLKEKEQGVHTLRFDGRKNDQMREVKITKNYLKYAKGSVLIEVGDTKVICGASVEEKVPPFLKGTGKGWVRAEYSMLPCSSVSRTPRESTLGRINGRTHEIQRLIGRSLRAVVDLDRLGERTLIADCDVIQADGGTRTASITGAYIAMVDALKQLLREGVIEEWPVKGYLAAISVGIQDGNPILDLNYEEDSTCEVDLNLVMTDKGEIVEIQGTAEEAPFEIESLNELIELAKKGIYSLIDKQKEVLKEGTW
jgi:ribonuclease PH